MKATRAKRRQTVKTPMMAMMWRRMARRRSAKAWRGSDAAADMNLLREPQEVIVELSEQVLLELSGNRELHQLRYPTFIVCTHPNFQLRAIEGLAAIKGTALKELDLSNNKLMVLDALEQFSTLKTLKATRNLIAEVTIERLPRLKPPGFVAQQAGWHPRPDGLQGARLPQSLAQPHRHAPRLGDVARRLGELQERVAAAAEEARPLV